MQEINRMSTERKSSSEAESSKYHLDRKEQETDSDKRKKADIEGVRKPTTKKSSTDKGPQEHDQPKKCRTEQGGDSDQTDRTPKKEEVRRPTTRKSSTETRQQEHDQPKKGRNEQGGDSDKTDKKTKKEEEGKPTTRKSSTETRQQEHDQPKKCRTEQGGDSNKTDKKAKKEVERKPTTRKSSTEARQQEHDQPKKCRTEQGGDSDKTDKKTRKEEERKLKTRISSTKTRQQEHDQPKKRRTEQGGDSDQTDNKAKKEEERKLTTRKSSTDIIQQEHDQPKKCRTEQGSDSNETNKKAKKEEEKKPTRKSSTETIQQEHDQPKKGRTEQGGDSDKTKKKAKKEEEKKPTKRKSSTETRQQEHDQPKKTKQDGDSDKTDKKAKKEEGRKPTTRRSSTDGGTQEYQPKKDRTKPVGESDMKYEKKKIKKVKLEAAFFDKDTPHGFVKRFMYMRYLERFIASTQQSKYDLVTKIYDVSAGAGRYSKEWPVDIVKYGSPLIALHVAICHFIWKKTLPNKFKPSEAPLINKERTKTLLKYNIQLHLIEKNSENFKTLIKNIRYLFMFYDIEIHVAADESMIHTLTSRDENFPISVTVKNDEFINIMPVLNKMECMTTFIDLFGFSQAPFDKIKHFCGKYKSVYINFLSSFVNRFLDKDENQDYVEKCFGMKLYQIKTFVSKTKGKQRQSALVDLYLDQLKTCNPFALTFEMRQSRNVPLYDLVFVTSHAGSLKAMKEAFNRGTQSYTGKFAFSDFIVLHKGQIIDTENKQDNNQVANVIFDEYKGTEKVSIETLKNFIIENTLFVWRKTPLKILVNDERIVEVKRENGDSPKIRGTFPDKINWLISFSEMKTHPQ